MKKALLLVTTALLLAIVSARGIRDERDLRDSIEKALIMEDELARISMLKRGMDTLSMLTRNVKPFRTFSSKIRNDQTDPDTLGTNRGPKTDPDTLVTSPKKFPLISPKVTFPADSIVTFTYKKLLKEKIEENRGRLRNGERPDLQALEGKHFFFVFRVLAVCICMHSCVVCILICEK